MDEKEPELLRSSEVAPLYMTDNKNCYYITGLPDNNEVNRFPE